MIADLTIAAGDIDRRTTLSGIDQLREIASADFSKATSSQTRVISDIKAFVQWADDKRPQFADAVDGEDKFAHLINIARNYPDCTSYFVSEVGVNTSTVWRWASGKSRPSRYVGKRLADEVKAQLVRELIVMAKDEGLLVSPL